MERTRKPLKAVVNEPMHKHISSDPRVQEMAGDALFNGRPYYKLDKQLLKQYGPMLAIFLAYTHDKWKYFKTIGKLEEDGSFFLRHEDIQESTGLTEYAIKKCKKELIEMGWISTKMKKVPQKEYYYLHLDKAVQQYKKEEEQQNLHRINPPETTGLIPPKSPGLIPPKSPEYNKNIIIKRTDIDKKTKTKKTTSDLIPDKEKEKERVVSTSDWIIQLYPQEWQDSPSFQESMKDYIQHRKEKGSSITSKSATRLTEKLTQFTITEATQALNTSIENGWQGVFPERISKGFTPKRLGNAHKVPGKKYPTGDVYY